MGTRGLYGIIVGEEQKLTYNHFDSYPSGLGADLLEFIKRNDSDQLFEDAVALEVIDGETPPTAAQKERARSVGTVDTDVSEQSENDWYCLLRGAQGDLRKTLDVGVMVDGANFANDSLFCEWGYVIDLDNRIFEVYRGFQEEPHEGRFTKNFNPADTHMFPPGYEGDDRDPSTCVRCKQSSDSEAAKKICSGNTYYPIKRIAWFPLDALPDNLEAVEKSVYGSEEDE
jgi:hypothetical protein